MTDRYLLRLLECVDCGETQPLRADPYTGFLWTSARCELCRETLEAALWERRADCE